MNKILSCTALFLACTIVVLLSATPSTAASSDTTPPAATAQKYPPSVKMIGMGVTCADCHGAGEKAEYSSLIYEKCVRCHNPFDKIAKTTEAAWGHSITCTTRRTGARNWRAAIATPCTKARKIYVCSATNSPP